MNHNSNSPVPEMAGLVDGVHSFGSANEVLVSDPGDEVEPIKSYEK